MTKKLFVLLLSMFSLTAINNSNAQEAMIGEIKLFAGNFTPRNWAFCITSQERPSQVTVQSGMTGASEPVNNIQPTLTVNYMICVSGVFPSKQ